MSRFTHEENWTNWKFAGNLVSAERFSTRDMGALVAFFIVKMRGNSVSNFSALRIAF